MYDTRETSHKIPSTFKGKTDLGKTYLKNYEFSLVGRDAPGPGSHNPELLNTAHLGNKFNTATRDPIGMFLFRPKSISWTWSLWEKFNTTMFNTKR